MHTISYWCTLTGGHLQNGNVFFFLQSFSDNKTVFFSQKTRFIFTKKKTTIIS